MIPTPGQKVWVENSGGHFPAGTYAAVAIRPNDAMPPGWWKIEFEDIPNYPLLGQSAHQQQMRPRDDSPPQQEPKREAVGNWDACVWKPAREVV